MAQKVISLYEELKKFTELNFRFGYDKDHMRELIYDVNLPLEKKYSKELKLVLNKHKAYIKKGYVHISGLVDDEPIHDFLVDKPKYENDYKSDLFDFIMGEYEPKPAIRLITFVKSRKFKINRELEYALFIYDVNLDLIKHIVGLHSKKEILEKIDFLDNEYFYVDIDLFELESNKLESRVSIFSDTKYLNID